VTLAIASRVHVRNGPPLAVSTMRRTRLRGLPARHWKIALCSLSTGSSCAFDRAATAVMTSPAETSDSLFASATVRPPRSAASVEGNPAHPTIEAIVQSAPLAAASTTASAPAATAVSVPCSASFNAL